MKIDTKPIADEGNQAIKKIETGNDLYDAMMASFANVELATKKFNDDRAAYLAAHADRINELHNASAAIAQIAADNAADDAPPAVPDPPASTPPAAPAAAIAA